MAASVLPSDTSVAPARRTRADGAVSAWLFLCSAMVFAMVVVGGITRLTHSGLSIVEWKPIMGTLPPLDAAQWDETFHKYQQTPEFRLVNHAMSLGEFKGIFWWEYIHRLLGRSIGLVFMVPLLAFMARGRIRRAQAPRFLFLFILGGLQGALGWYMVKSGLVDDPRVSQYRLTAHLGMAFLIYAALFWNALDLYPARRARSGATPVPPALRRSAYGLTALTFVMVLSGGLVAGIHAGLAYNTFPLMNGNIIPPESFVLEPAWRNFFDNMALVQFDHRAIAWILAGLVPLLWWRVQTRPGVPAGFRLRVHLWLAALLLQLALGITTLLLRVPVPVAATHQAGALLLFTAALFATHCAVRPAPR